MKDRTDAELVEEARKGEVSSFGELYCRHYAGAVGIAYHVLFDHHLAEDAAQEAFAIACRGLGDLRRADRFASWLGAICRKVAIRVAKSRLRCQLSESVNRAPNEKAGDERREVVRTSVGRLSRSAKKVIVLRYFSGLSHRQMAVMLGISEQAVHGRLIRARRKIAADLRRNGLGRRKQ